MNFDLTGKRVLVSAGGSGIGRAIVEGFVAQGAKVVTCDINPDFVNDLKTCLLYTSPSPRDLSTSRMPSSA